MFLPGLIACFEMLNRIWPPRPCTCISRAAAVAKFLWAKKFSSNALRSAASSRSSIAPPVAEPAFETRMSSPPKAWTVAAIAASAAPSAVMSAACTACHLPRLSRACAKASAFRSTSIRFAPKAAKALAVARPMAPAPPVTITTRPWKGGGAPLPSLACSSDQYSQSNWSFSPSG